MKKSLICRVLIKLTHIVAVCVGFLYLFAAFMNFVEEHLLPSAIQLVIGLSCLKFGNICRDATSAVPGYVAIPNAYDSFNDLLTKYEGEWENFSELERQERSKELDRAYIKLEASEAAEFKNKKEGPTEERLMIKYILFERKNALYLRIS